MPRFLTPIFVREEFVTGNETISGNETILGVTSGRDAYWDNTVIHGGLTANSVSATQNVSAAYFYGDGRYLTNISGTDSTKLPLSGGTLTNGLTGTNGIFTISLSSPSISGTYYGNGSNLTNLNASNISSGTLSSARLPAFTGDITTTVGTSNATVVKLQGYTISTATPSAGQMLQWSGTEWVPGSIPTGGSGGGGISYYLNYGLSANSPTAGLSGTLYQLGRVATNTLSSVTFNNVSQVNWDTLATFVTDRLDPYVTAIPAGIWDLNIWVSSTASIQSQMTIRYLLFTYSESLSSATLIATSDVYSIYDPSVVARYVVSMIVPQTTVDINSRFYFVLQAQSTSANKNITIYYNDGKPTHVHTTIPSIGGSGLVKVINGIYQNPASLLVDVDVATNAQISQTKISGLTAALDNKFDKSGGTVNGNLTVTETFSTVNTNNWTNTYNTVNSNSGKWESVYNNVNSLSNNWQNTYSTTNSNSANWNTAYSSTTGLDLKYLNLSGGIISGNLTVTEIFSTVNTNNWTNTYNTVSSNSAKWESVYTNVNTNSSTYISLTGTQTLTNKTIIDWMTLVRGYKTTPSLSASLSAGDVYTYTYSTTGTDLTYYRYIATNGSEDKFYSYFSGNTLSGLIASKQIIL